MSNDRASILIVDDDPINRTLLSHTLARQGHSTRMAEDGHEALETVAAEAFDVVLLDVVMPGIDGYEVLKSLKDNSKRRHIPVIMISALDEMESVIRCIEMGAEDYLLKPFDPMLLRARINAGLAKKRLHDLELDYIEQVGHVVDAAAQVENGSFSSESLDEVATRKDALGRLARVFREMAHEVQAREQRLKREVQKLRIEIDEATAARQVAEITETDYFQDLQTKADEMRLRAQTSS
jgi:two-component system, cell cycle response regulator